MSGLQTGMEMSDKNANSVTSLAFHYDPNICLLLQRPSDSQASCDRTLSEAVALYTKRYIDLQQYIQASRASNSVGIEDYEDELYARSTHLTSAISGLQLLTQISLAYRMGGEEEKICGRTAG